jgi:thioredoxin 1
MKRNEDRKSAGNNIDIEKEWERLEGIDPEDMTERDRKLWHDIFLQHLVDFKHDHEAEWGDDYRGVIDKLLERGGICPCKPLDAEDNKCPCNEAVEKLAAGPGKCRCGLFVKPQNPLEGCREPLYQIYEILDEAKSVSDPVSVAVVKAQVMEHINIGVRYSVDHSMSGIYKTLDKYSVDELLLAVKIMESASTTEPGELFLNIDLKHGEQGNRVLRDLVGMGLIRYKLQSVDTHICETLRMRVMLTDPALAPHIVEGKVSVIDFSAEWCGPCKKMGITLDKMAEEFDDLVVTEFDVDKDKDKVGKYGFRAVPVAVIFGKDRSLYEILNGFPGEQELRELIELVRG